MNGIGGHMRPKPCSLCGQLADVSFVVLASTLRVHPRRQQTSPSIPFCHWCVESFLRASLPSVDRNIVSPLTGALTTTYNALTNGISSQPIQESDTKGSHADQQAVTGTTSADGTEASCRPCLIACNSRHYDEVATSKNQIGNGRDGD